VEPVGLGQLADTLEIVGGEIVNLDLEDYH
jgi:hypothetical protein